MDTLRSVLASLGVAVALVACGHPSEPSTTTTTTGSGPPPTSTTPCTLGEACSVDGATCVPETIGTGWAHGYYCSGGRWTELEIAPLPQPPPQPAPPTT